MMKRSLSQVCAGKTAALFSGRAEAGGVIAEADATAGAGAFNDYGECGGGRWGIRVSRSWTICWTTRATPSRQGKNTSRRFSREQDKLDIAGDARAVALADYRERAFWTRTIREGRPAGEGES